MFLYLLVLIYYHPIKYNGLLADATYGYGGPKTGVVTMPNTPVTCLPIEAACPPPGIVAPSARFQFSALAPKTTRCVADGAPVHVRSGSQQAGRQPQPSPASRLRQADRQRQPTEP